MRKRVTVRNFRASFEGVRATSRKGTRSGRVAYRVRINMRGLTKGVYAARAIYQVRVGNGVFKRRMRVHLFRPCYGNPKGGRHEGLNRLPIDII